MVIIQGEFYTISSPDGIVIYGIKTYANHPVQTFQLLSPVDYPHLLCFSRFSLYTTLVTVSNI